MIKNIVKRINALLKEIIPENEKIKQIKSGQKPIFRIFNSEFRITNSEFEYNCEPFSGIGKPEPLKHNLSGYWSERTDDVNRIVYRITDEQIEIIQCKGHYKD